jgi:hypothetical protein
VFKRGASPSFYIFPLSFILPRKERGIQGVRLRKSGGKVVRYIIMKEIQ